MFEREIRLAPPVEKGEILLDVAFCYPGSYEIGMAGLGLQLVWWLFEQHRNVMVRRCFEDVDQHGGRACDLYGFTLSWELDFLTVLRMLEKYGIARQANDRDDEAPIVFGGGPVLSANPEPYASIFDVVLVGDAEVTVPAFLEVAISTRHLPRSERLKRFAAEPGLYVPASYEVDYESLQGEVRRISPIEEYAPEKVRRQSYKLEGKISNALAEDNMACTKILSPDTTWGATYLMEVVRSCPQECRFCLASYLTRPFRYVPADTIIDAALSVSKHTEKIGLLGPSITEHPEFDTIASRLASVGDLRVNIASVRADTLSEELVRNIARLGQKSVTIALESGSQRLRDIMKKNLTEEQVYEAVNAIASGGLKKVKFYGIAGLPYEEQGDLDETIRLITSLKKEFSSLRFVFGLSSFVPKAQTPFQRCGRDRRCKKKMEYLRKHMAKAGIEVRAESHNWSDVQALLSRGDRRLTEMLLELSGTEASLGFWKKAFRDRRGQIPALDYYVFENYSREQILPWNHLVPEEKLAYLDKHLEIAADLSQAPVGLSEGADGYR